MTATTGSDQVVVDSSGWLEALTGDTKAVPFQSYLQREPSLFVPTIVIYEVYRKLRNEFSTNAAVRFLSHALRCQVVPMDEDLAVAAALFSIEHSLHMADAIIYATARAHQAELVTSDEHFRGLPGVTLI